LHSNARSPTTSRACGKKERTMPLPKNYRTIEEFQREELRPQYKVGFSFDDLMQETMLHENDLLFDDQVDEYEPDEDDEEDED
jgi:hypothetical protein